MPYLRFKNVGITGIAACVPPDEIDNMAYTHFMSHAEIASVVKMTGIARRRFANSTTCASDLCVSAAQCLMTQMKIEKCDIDILIFVSQTPDYRTPPTSMMIADRLGLGKDVGAFDVNLGCSGFVYGLQIAFQYASQEGIRKVLLLNGETKSKAYSTKDKSTSLLFGDGATAVIVESIKDENSTIMSMHSNGAGSMYILMPAGGYRKPSSHDTLVERTYPDGSVRTEEHGTMDGEAVFNFTITDVPKDIKSIMNEAEITSEELDYFVPHQANKFITDHIAKKIKIPYNKILYSMHKYGNTSSVSIPLTIADIFETGRVIENSKVLMTGFGVGLSWGSVITDLNGLYNCGVIEYRL
ncbi:MAG: ketoacyl-ACP synthase III [Proteiniphilum sp.]|nr:ketoacyl-ACP synthase III [Proteiniphilum sp.]